MSDPTAIRQAYVSPNASQKATTEIAHRARIDTRARRTTRLQSAGLRVSCEYQLVFRGLTTVGDTGI